ncbi:MAG: GNAT family N-acetyltransferase [Alphaproteobacteria bacterium]|nr:GNAT family N-acetyltransferase [Alphaproteobacteria bacterium]
MTNDIPLRPYLPQDLMALRDLFAQSIEELTQEEYDEDQRLAWISRAADAEAFGQRLAGATTLVVEVEGDLAGFGSLKDNRFIDMLYIHPYFVGRGIGTALADALETLAKARGAKDISVDASDTAADFFAERGYVPTARNSVPLDDQWLMNTTMTKRSAPPTRTTPNEP